MYVVIGGTGRIGKRVTRLLVDHGHDVLAVNRRPERAAVVLAGLAVRTDTVDAADYPSIERCVQGADAVVLATAPTREAPAAYLDQTINVLRAVRTAGVSRLVAVSNHMALRAPDGRSMLEAAPPHPYFRSIEEVFAQQAERFYATEDVDWLLLAPPAELFPYGDVTGTYRIGVDVLLVSDPANPNFAEVSRLSMEDFAALVVEEVEHPRHHRQLMTAAY